LNPRKAGSKLDRVAPTHTTTMTTLPYGPALAT
jgi:hypothetical protein